MRISHFRKPVLAWFLFFLAILLEAGVCAAATGAAFIHGKGSADLYKLPEARKYWGSDQGARDLVSTATKGKRIPYIVCHYNGTQHMKDAAKTVAEQLDKFIKDKGIDDLVITTHSFGGIVIRYIFSNPENSARNRRIIDATRWVNTIAAPHLGSKAADRARQIRRLSPVGRVLLWFGGQNDAATRNLETGQMKYYNRNVLFGTNSRPALPTRFFHLYGTNRINDNCQEDHGLNTIHNIVWINPFKDSDGMVTPKSARAVGTLKNGGKLKANHHHNRRNGYERGGRSEEVGRLLARDFK